NSYMVTIKYSSSIPLPRLDFQKQNSQLVLNWTNANFILQSAPALTGTFTNIPAATSPFTNSLTGPQQFFRLISNCSRCKEHLKPPLANSDNEPKNVLRMGARASRRKHFPAASGNHFLPHRLTKCSRRDADCCDRDSRAPQFQFRCPERGQPCPREP